MGARLQIGVDWDNQPQLPDLIASAAVAVTPPDVCTVWCFFGSTAAGESLASLIKQRGDPDAVVYRCAPTFLDRVEVISRLIAACHQIPQGSTANTLTCGQPAVRGSRTLTKSLRWIDDLYIALGESRIHDAWTLFSRVGVSDIDEELVDLAGVTKDAAALCARILRTEIDLVHQASVSVARDPSMLLTEQFMSEGYFRLWPHKIKAVDVDLAKHAIFAPRRDLFNVLEVTAKKFRQEVIRNQYGVETSRLFVIHIAFLYQAAINELAAKRLNEAFVLVFKAFECLVIWEALVERLGFLDSDRLFDQTTRLSFKGLGSLLIHVSASLGKRDAKIADHINSMISRRNITRIGHGLLVITDAEIRSYAQPLLPFLKSTAAKRHVADYYERLEDSFVFSGFAQQIQILSAAQVLSSFRVVLPEEPQMPEPSISAPSPTPPKQATRSTLSLRRRVA